MNKEKLFFEIDWNKDDKEVCINLVEEDYDYKDIDEEGYVIREYGRSVVYGLEGVIGMWLDCTFNDNIYYRDEDKKYRYEESVGGKEVKKEVIRIVEKYKDRCETFDEVEEECYIKTFFTGWD